MPPDWMEGAMFSGSPTRRRIVLLLEWTPPLIWLAMAIALLAR
jgi:hypothetical protein